MYFKNITFFIVALGLAFGLHGMKKKGSCSEIISFQKTQGANTGEEATLLGLSAGLRMLERKQDEMEIKITELEIHQSEDTLKKLEGETYTVQIEDLCRKFAFLTDRVETLEKENGKLKTIIKQLAAKNSGSKKTKKSKRSKSKISSKGDEPLIKAKTRKRAITEILGVVKTKPSGASSKDDSCRVASLPKPLDESLAKSISDEEITNKLMPIFREQEVDTLVLRDGDLSCQTSEADVSSDEES